MAGNPKRMGQIKQLIRLYVQGRGKRTIARELGISKNTCLYCNTVITTQIPLTSTKTMFWINVKVLKQISQGACNQVYVTAPLTEKQSVILEISNEIWNVLYRNVFLDYFNERQL